MKGKYITTQIKLACLRKPAASIHEQLLATLEERARIMKELEKLRTSARVIEMYLSTMEAV